MSADWLPHTFEQLDRVRNLPPGWDSHGAGPVEPAAVAAAKELLSSLVEELQWTGSNARVAKPSINPTPSGGVQLEWESGSRCLEVEVLRDHGARYFYQDSASRIEAEGELSVGAPLADLIRYLLKVVAAKR
ncbi:MAG: hypothetical protein HY721_16955 [Planctomycetes bacterium]|nr:hypothetical protein [Planctomycetota bacterium]